MPVLPRTATVRDLLLGAAVTLVALVELWLAADRVEGPLLWHVLMNLLILPGLAIRRLWPLGAALLAAVSMALQPLVGTSPVATGFLVLLFVLASLGWYADSRTGLVGVAAVLAGGLVFDVTAEDFLLADLVVNVVIIVAAWGAARGIRIATDRRVAAEVDAERAALVAVQEERGRISRDLHDSLAHALTLITLRAGGARERTSDPLAEEALGTIEDTGREAIADLHRFLQLLATPAGEPPGITHLPDLVDGVRRSGVLVTLEVASGTVPPGVSTAVYRVVQEGLTNAVRHSDATAVTVAVRRADRALVAQVSSIGPARLAATPGSGRGLIGLRERLSLFGGSLESAPTDDGWRLEARIPLGTG
ncbi:MAG: sensor histidine kinase [Nocardioides sp.]